MTRSLWLPFYLGLGLLLIALPIILLLPRTQEQPKAKPSEDDASENSPLLNRASMNPTGASNAAIPPNNIFRKLLSDLWALRDLISGRRNFQLLLGAHMSAAVASSSMAVLVQYISKRYGWAFAQVCT